MDENEKEELKQELEQELLWVKYRKNMLDIIDEKLFQMREIAEKIKNQKLSKKEIEELNSKISILKMQVKAIDGESRKTEDGKIIE